MQLSFHANAVLYENKLPDSPTNFVAFVGRPTAKRLSPSSLTKGYVLDHDGAWPPDPTYWL